MAIQQLFLGLGAKKKTYVDDIFSTYLWKGSGSARSINNGIDLSGEGGATWIKSRSNAEHNWLFDTINGADWSYNSDRSNARYNSGSSYMSSFNNNGFSIGTHDGVNDASMTYGSWSFRKAPGFFDVVQYDGNGSNRTISHSLGSVPGLIMIKRTDDPGEWICYHRSVGAEKFLQLDNNEAENDDNTVFNDTEPTASVFSLGTHAYVNTNGGTYIAYVFAGGESTAATAKSVPFDGTNDYLSIAENTDLNLGAEFTIEAWVNVDDGGWSGTRRTLLANSTGWTTNHAAISLMNSASSHEENTIILYNNTSTIADSSPVRIEPEEGWTHIAITRDSGNDIRIFKNGFKVGDTATYSGNFNFGDGETWIGAVTMSTGSTPETFDGKISNLRVIKGTALYTKPFKPPTEPLTNVTNTKLLCCNNSSATGSTVTPATISGNGGLSQGINDSPFDDPAGFVFGDTEDQSVIKTGSYIGNGNSTGPKIYLGFEPQWILIKNASTSSDWRMFDSMRGIKTNDKDFFLGPHDTSAESTGTNGIDLTSTGFKIVNTATNWNGDGHTITYIAIRRPDGYVGKPAKVGTDVFNITAGQNSEPGFVAGFPVDWVMARDPSSSGAMYTGARLQGEYALGTHSNAAEFATTSRVYDYSDGWNVSRGANSPEKAWQWKRHAGFDVVTWKGYDPDGVRPIAHNLGRVPEMIWMKARDYAGNWSVYHKGLNGGTNPEQYNINLNNNSAEVDWAGAWADVAPTATHWTVGNDNAGNGTYNYIACLFASISGISKVGYYTGNGSSTERTITLGFQPRFIMVRNTDTASDWEFLDTVRGWSSGSDDQRLWLNLTNAQDTGLNDIGGPTSTGFTITESHAHWNADGDNYIYYAHA